MIETVLSVLTYLLSIVCWCAIFRKAGYSSSWGLSALIPFVPILWLALATWPAVTMTFLSPHLTQTPEPIFLDKAPTTCPSTRTTLL